MVERTGLSQDVLRAWERRYDAVRPTRDANGQRQYSDADIRRLGLLHAATRAGRSIGSVALLSTEEIALLVEGDLFARESALDAFGARRDAAASGCRDGRDAVH
ncbi:MAG: MerR family transcriptional regulator [Gemmatimonadaceae bacterium]